MCRLGDQQLLFLHLTLQEPRCQPVGWASSTLGLTDRLLAVRQGLIQVHPKLAPAAKRHKSRFYAALRSTILAPFCSALHLTVAGIAWSILHCTFGLGPY